MSGKNRGKVGVKDDEKIELERVFRDKKSNVSLKDREKLLALPSGKLNKGKRRKFKGSKKVMKHFETVSFEFQRTQPNHSDSLSQYSEYTQSNELSELGDGDLGVIYEAIDELNKLCMEPIKAKLKKDYVKIRNNEGKDSEELKYSADINIVLSNKNDFSLRVESIEDSHNESQSETNKPISHFSTDSVRSLEPISASVPNSYTINPVNSDSHSFNLTESNDTTNSVKSSEPGNSVDSVVLGDNVESVDEGEKVLFYRIHDPNGCYYTAFAEPNSVKNNSPLNSTVLGFDSVESLNNALNAPSEIIIKPPVTIGRTISFKTKVSKCVLSRDRFITNTVFQVNWLNSGNTRRKRRLDFICC